MAPSTPPPPGSVRLAALTIASTSRVVMSPVTTSMRARAFTRVTSCTSAAGTKESHHCNYACGIAGGPPPAGCTVRLATRKREGGQMKLPVATDPDDRSWQDYANCLGVDPDLFFPERGASTREAKEVCLGCVVRAQGLEDALEHPE